MPKTREIQISKAITNPLRHNAHKASLSMDQNGWVLDILPSPRPQRGQPQAPEALALFARRANKGVSPPEK